MLGCPALGGGLCGVCRPLLRRAVALTRMVTETQATLRSNVELLESSNKQKLASLSKPLIKLEKTLHATNQYNFTYIETKQNKHKSNKTNVEGDKMEIDYLDSDLDEVLMTSTKVKTEPIKIEDFVSSLDPLSEKIKIEVDDLETSSVPQNDVVDELNDDSSDFDDDDDEPIIKAFERNRKTMQKDKKGIDKKRMQPETKIRKEIDFYLKQLKDTKFMTYLLKKHFKERQANVEDLEKCTFKKKMSTDFLNAKFKCNTCYKFFADEKTCTEHLWEHKTPGKLTCQICLNIIPSSSLNEHWSSQHHDLKMFDCVKCEFRTFCRDTAMSHGYHNHEVTTYECEDCDRTFNTRISLKRHQTKVHLMDYACKSCGNSYQSQQALTEHFQMKPECQDSENEEGDGYECSSCDVLFRSEAALALHRRVSPKHNGRAKARKKPIAKNKTDEQKPLQMIVDQLNANVSTIKVEIEWKPESSSDDDNSKDDDDESMGDDDHSKVDDAWKDSDDESTKMSDTEQVKKRKIKVNQQMKMKQENTKFIHKHFNVRKATVDEQKNMRLQMRMKKTYIDAEFKCTLCYKWFADVESYNEHKLEHEQPDRVHCDICLRSISKDFIKAHIDRHKTNSLIYNCKSCDFKTLQRLTALTHGNIHDGRKLQCSDCGKCFRRSSNLYSHMRAKHPLDIICDICGYSFLSEPGLRDHKRRGHRKESTEPLQGEGHPCVECDIVFRNEEALKVHRKVSPKHGGSRSNLPKSNKVQLIKKKMRKERKPLPEVNVVCDQCGLVFRTTRGHRQHLAMVHGIHKGASAGFCNLCNKSYANKYQHSYTHRVGNEKIQCPVCSKEFQSKLQIKSHMMTHEEPKHECNVCGKKFNSMSNMMRHVKYVHSETKPFQCHLCAKSYKDSPTLKLHVTHVHDKVPWPARPNRCRRTDASVSGALLGEISDDNNSYDIY